MSNYYSKRDAKVNIQSELVNRGWKIYGYKADESDSMTDYYSPAYWEGIATNNGYVLVVDCKHNSNSERVVTKTTNTSKINSFDKISKLKNMTVSNGCTEAEANAALVQIAKINQKQKESTTTEVLSVYPKYQANPKGCIWHLEKDGEIIVKGRSLTVFADLPKSYMFDLDTESFLPEYEMVNQWNGYTNERETIKRELDTDEIKAVKEFKIFLSKLEAATSIKIGEGKEESLVKKVTYKTVTKIVKQEVTRESELQTNDVVWCDGLCKVTAVNADTNTYNVIKISNSTFKESKANGSNFRLNKQSFDSSLKRGSLKVYNIVEVEEQKEVIKWVKPTTKKATVKKETPKEVEQVEEIATTQESIKENNIIEDVKIVLNQEKNGVELYFNNKPDEDVRNNMKANGFFWNRKKVCWNAKQTESTLNFANSLNNKSEQDIKEVSEEYKENKELELNNKLNDININDIENYIVPEEISKRENDNSFFRNKPIDHTKQLQNTLSNANNEVLEVLQNNTNITIEYNLKMSLQRFKRDYTEATIKYLNTKANNPSWMVTGRDGRNARRDSKMNDRQTNAMFKCNEIIEKFNKSINIAKNQIRKEKSDLIKQEIKESLDTVKELPKFKRIKKEITTRFGSYNKMVYEYSNYSIFKDCATWSVYNPEGKQVYKSLTTGTLEECKKWLIYNLNKAS